MASTSTSTAMSTISTTAPAMGEPNINELPLEVIQNILSKLPILSRLEARCVCPTWRSLIKPTQISLMVCSCSTYLFYIPSILTFHKAIKLTNIPFEIDTVHLMVSFNGILCLVCDKPGIVFCNPVTGDWIKAPDPVSRVTKPYGSLLYGVGCNLKENQFKVVRMKYDEILGGYEVQVFTLGSNEWRVSHTVEPFNSCSNGGVGVCVNGYLHWLVVPQSIPCRRVYNFNSRRVRYIRNSRYLERGNDMNEGFGPVKPSGGVQIKYFDIEDETFGLLPVPDETKYRQNLYLGRLRGCLLLGDYTQEGVHRVWMLKNESWVLEFVIPRPEFLVPRPGCTRFQLLRPLGLLQNGNVLLCDTRSLSSYDPETGKHELLKIPGLPYFFSATFHVRNHLSLNDVIATTYY